MKTCNNCKNELTDDKFPNWKSKTGTCKECHNLKKRERRQKNREETNAKNKQYREKNPDKVREWNKRSRQKPGRKSWAEWRREWGQKNRDYVNQKERERYRKKHPLRIKVKQDAETKKEKARSYCLHKYHNDTNFKLVKTLRNRLRKALQLQSATKRLQTLDLIGCSIDELFKYLESKFLPGMTWENHSKNGWHIDHIRPCCSFDLSDEQQLKACFHYTNLQPLWAFDNHKKGGK